MFEHVWVEMIAFITAVWAAGITGLVIAGTRHLRKGGDDAK